MNKLYRTINDGFAPSGFSFKDSKEHPKRQPNAAPSIREVINKFKIGIPIGQYVRNVEFGDYEDPTKRPEFDFAAAAALRQRLEARRRLHLASEQPEAADSPAPGAGSESKEQAPPAS